MDKTIGKKLDGRYEITELIGIGGMADVYKAVDLAEDRTVAVKILKNEFAGNDDFVRRFRNESKAIAVLSHPNIVKIYDVGFNDKIQFIVMEYIDGITLKEFMEQQGVLKWKDSVHFIIQILRALQHAHDRGIVHRDIKPQNIMLFPDGTIKVMDFGIARFAREEGKTISDKAIGSVHYISPEQASGDITDEKSDIYSVGVMLYEMLTGVKPFDADTPIAVALMHMQQNPKPPRTINDTIPEGLEAIVMRAMQRDASKRYQSASEMIKDIEEFKHNPSIVFEYSFEESSGEQTRYFDKPKAADVSDEDEEVISGPRFKESAPKKNQKKSKSDEVVKTKSKKKKEEEYEPEDYDDDYDDDDYDDDDDEEVSKSSYFVTTLTAITAAVVIVAVVFIAVVFIRNFLNIRETTDMIDLRGYDFNDVQRSYEKYFTLVMDGDPKYNADYPAGTIIEHSPKAGSPIIVGSTEVRAVVSKGPQMIPVPNVYLLPSRTAESMITGKGLKVQFIHENNDIESDLVIRTDPERNLEVQKDSTVYVYVSMGPFIEDVLMQNYVGQKMADAVADLESKGFKVTLQEIDSVEEQGTVLSQSINAVDEEGQPNIVSPNQTIVITYSSGTVPMTELNITFAVPDRLEGKAVFNAYVNGNLSGSISIDNIGYVSTVSIPVEGKDTQKVILEVVDESGNKHNIGEYNVDFNTGEKSEVRFDKDKLRELYGLPEETTAATVPEDNGDNPFPDPGAGGVWETTAPSKTEEEVWDWWSVIAGGR